MFIIDSTINMPDIQYLVDRVMESCEEGIKINVDNVQRLEKRFRDNRIALKEQIKMQYGIENVDSPKQVVEYFKREFTLAVSKIINEYNLQSVCTAQGMVKALTQFVGKYPYKTLTVEILETYIYMDDLDSDTKEILVEAAIKCMQHPIFKSLAFTGKWSSEKRGLIDLAMIGSQAAKDILTYRKNASYSLSLESLIKACRGNHRIYPVVSCSITNRINYSNPALMNIPKDLLWNVIAPRKDGNTLVSIDIKNQEPWILANMLDIEPLKNMLGTGKGLYENIFNAIFGRDPEPLERMELKTCWNALSYGATKKLISYYCKHIDSDAVYKYFNSFPEMKDYKSKIRALAKQKVALAYTYFETELHADNSKKNLRNILMNIPIQGTGSDILSLLIMNFDAMCEMQGIENDIHFYYSRHDEVIVEVEDEYIRRVGMETVLNQLRDIFEHKIDDWEPFNVKVMEVGNHEIELDTDNSLLDDVE